MSAPRAVTVIATLAMIAGTGSITAMSAAAVTHHSHHHVRRQEHKSGGIPQHNGGDRDADNNGGPSDGDGNV